jgi:hypothetical protein
VQSGASGKADLALFDPVTAGVLREIAAVHRGRVDPRTLGWGYDVRPKKLDWAAVARSARAGKGVPAVLDAPGAVLPALRPQPQGARAASCSKLVQDVGVSRDHRGRS